MAKFKAELPLDLIKQFESLADGGASKMLEEMVDAGAEVAYKNVQKNMKTAFKDTSRLEKHLKKTRVYRTASGDSVNVKVAFYGYMPTKTGKKFKITKTLKSGKKKTYEYDGVPVPLIIQAREYGTSRGEKSKRFLFKSFKKAEITQAMLKVQEKYLKNE